MQHSSAPAINPADLAAIIARDRDRGFAASLPRRAPSLNGATGFQPANYGADALRIVPAPAPAALSGPDATPSQGSGAAETHVPHAPPPARDFDAELAEAFAAGRQAGVQDGLAQSRATAEATLAQTAQNDLSAARALFLRAAEALTLAEADLSQDIARSVETAVMRLAADRAGQAITENPAPFMARIEQLADRVSHGLRSVRVALHPDDLAVVEDHLLGFLPPGSLMVASPALMRGDVVIKAPSVTVSDLLMEGKP